MCGRFTVEATWAELIALYRLTMAAPPHNLRPRYNVCPTDPVDVVTAEEGKRELAPMRAGDLCRGGGASRSRSCAWRHSTPARIQSRPSPSFAMRLSAAVALSRSRDTTNGERRELWRSCGV